MWVPEGSLYRQRTAPGPLRYHFKPSLRDYTLTLQKQLNVFPSLPEKIWQHYECLHQIREGLAGVEAMAAQGLCTCPVCFLLLPLGGGQAHPAGTAPEGGGEPACALGQAGAGSG